MGISTAVLLIEHYPQYEKIYEKYGGSSAPPFRCAYKEEVYNKENKTTSLTLEYDYSLLKQSLIIASICPIRQVSRDLSHEEILDLIMQNTSLLTFPLKVSFNKSKSNYKMLFFNFEFSENSIDFDILQAVFYYNGKFRKDDKK